MLLLFCAIDGPQSSLLQINQMNWEQYYVMLLLPNSGTFTDYKDYKGPVETAEERAAVSPFPFV